VYVYVRLYVCSSRRRYYYFRFVKINGHHIAILPLVSNFIKIGPPPMELWCYVYFSRQRSCESHWICRLVHWSRNWSPNRLAQRLAASYCDASFMFFFMTMLLYAAVVCDVSACYSPLWSVIGDFISQLQTGQLSNDSFSTPCRYVQCCSMTQSKTNSFTEI